MRARAWTALVVLLGVGLGLAAACNPIFGIVQRTAGPTWCEEPAQAGSAYCDDFDRVTAATAAQEEPLAFNGTSAVTSVVASSPPNSLEVTSPAIVTDASAILVSTLVNFGESYSATQSPFRCSIDVQPAEMVALGQGLQGAGADGARVAVIGLGGQVQGTPFTEFVFVSVGHGGGIWAQLGSVGAGDGVKMIGKPCPVLNVGGVDKTWTTLQVSMSPVSSSRGAEAGPPDAGGQPCSLGDDDAGRPTYVAVIQYGAFEDAVLVPVTFAGQPLLGYGIVLAGSAPAISLHIDNAACSVQPDGGASLP